MTQKVVNQHNTQKTATSSSSNKLLPSSVQLASSKYNKKSVGQSNTRTTDTSGSESNPILFSVHIESTDHNEELIQAIRDENLSEIKKILNSKPSLRFSFVKTINDRNFTALDFAIDHFEAHCRNHEIIDYLERQFFVSDNTSEILEEEEIPAMVEIEHETEIETEKQHTSPAEGSNETTFTHSSQNSENEKLIRAIRDEDLPEIEKILNRRPSLNFLVIKRINNRGFTALDFAIDHFATHCDNHEIIDYLEDQLYVPNHRSNKISFTPSSRNPAYKSPPKTNTEEDEEDKPQKRDNTLIRIQRKII